MFGSVFGRRVSVVGLGGVGCRRVHVQKGAMTAGIKHMLENAIPFHSVLGITAEDVDRSRVVLRMKYGKHLIGDPSRPALHGGTISALADATGGFAAWAALPSLRWRVSTVDLRIDYVRPAGPEDLLCEGVVVHKGRRLIRVDMQVYTAEHEDLVALGRATFAIHDTHEKSGKPAPLPTA